MTKWPALTPVQIIARLLVNLSVLERRVVLRALETGFRKNFAPYTEEVLDACTRAYHSATEKQRWHILGCVLEFADLLQQQQEEFEANHGMVQIIGTIPEFLHYANQGALPPIPHGSLEARLAEIMRSARRTLDITIPYISSWGVDVLTLDRNYGRRPGLKVRILSLLTSAHVKQNEVGVLHLAEQFESAGASVEIRSPTDEEAAATGAIAVMHAKVMVADRRVGYLGTGNISKAALERGFELGFMTKGVVALKLWRVNDWVFKGHQVWRPGRRSPSIGHEREQDGSTHEPPRIGHGGSTPRFAKFADVHQVRGGDVEYLRESSPTPCGKGPVRGFRSGGTK